MHISALQFGKQFFETYCSALQNAVVHDIGAQDVNGSLHDVCPSHLGYVGVDFVEGRGVDIVLDDPYQLPFADNSLDVIVCSSCFEHSQFFWLAFLEMLRVLKPEGLLYLNVPSNGSFHRYPVDCWRFYPDSGKALEAWASREGYNAALLESFVGDRSPEDFASGGAWNDFVAVFVKDASCGQRYENRMLDMLPVCWNGLDAMSGQEVNTTFLSPDHANVAALQTAAALHRDEVTALQAAALRHRDEVAALQAAALQHRDELITLQAVALQHRDEMTTLQAAALRHRDEVAALQAAGLQHRDDLITLQTVALQHRDEMTTLQAAALRHRDEVVALQAAALQLRKECDIKDVKGRDAVARAHLQLTNTSLHVGQLEADLAQKNFELEEAEVNRQSILVQLDLQSEQAVWRHRRIEELLRSRSWRSTAAVRMLGTFARKLRNRGRGLLAETRKGSLSKADSLPTIGTSVCAAQTPELCPPQAAEVLDRASADAQAAAAIIAPTGLFDEVYYRTHYLDLQGVTQPLQEYCETGWKVGRNPSADFDTLYYLEAYPDIREAGMNPLLHYATAGEAEGRPALPPQRRKRPRETIEKEYQNILASDLRELFDSAFYLALYLDIHPAPVDPLWHYCETGWSEGRNPSDQFDTNAYLAAYSDIRESGINPLWHYVMAGAGEGRYSDPLAAVRYEADINFGHVSTDVKLVAFYHAPDWPSLWGAGGSDGLHPHHDAGYYDNTQANVLARHAQLARRHGLHGFCFAISAVDVNSLTSRSLKAWRMHRGIDMPFCAALEVPSSGCSDEVIAQLREARADPRWLRVDGRPMLLVRAAPAAFVELRHRLDAGQTVTSFMVAWGSLPADSMNCEALLDHPSNDKASTTYTVLASRGVAAFTGVRTSVVPVYPLVSLGVGIVQPTANGAQPKRMRLNQYRQWLDAAIEYARSSAPVEQRFVFADSWNDWHEGCVLEPDVKGGYSSLNETTCALIGLNKRRAMPKVSIVVTNFNHERFLRRRLDSIYGQTYKNIEVLLLDDCSSDQSRLLLDFYAAAHPEITRTLYNDANSGGVFRQWAKGIQAATGDLVWIAESDDFCDEHFLDVLVHCFEDESVMLASAQCVFIKSDETPLQDEFKRYVSDLACAAQWEGAYTATAHNEVINALGIKNTIPNASGVVFRRPVDMALLSEDWWLSMRVAGDWVFYLHLIRGGKIAYAPTAINYFRRYEGSTAESTYRKRVFYEEVGLASRTVAALYNVPVSVLELSRQGFHTFYQSMVDGNDTDFNTWYDFESVLRIRRKRQPNVLVSTMGFLPGGAEIFPIRLANEFKRQGLSVLLLSTGLNLREDGVRRMLRNDVPVVETSDLKATKELIKSFGIEVLNSHQWHVQKYPVLQSDVFNSLDAHVATLHGMIENGTAFGVTPNELCVADAQVSVWAYTADKNLGPFVEVGLYKPTSPRFVKVPNGIQQPAHIHTVSRAQMNVPDDAFVLCCVSRAIPDKGWQEAIDAVTLARSLSSRDIHLVLVGNGTVYDALRRSDRPPYVHLIGYSQNAAGYYAAADMGIMLTSFRSESFPMTIIDCLFAGRPFIATAVGEIGNMLTKDDEVAGALIGLENWKVPIEEAGRVIATFAVDAGLYQAARSIVPSVAERFSIAAVASRYVDLFDQCRTERTNMAKSPLD